MLKEEEVVEGLKATFAKLSEVGSVLNEKSDEHESSRWN